MVMLCVRMLLAPSVVLWAGVSSPDLQSLHCHLGWDAHHPTSLSHPTPLSCEPAGAKAPEQMAEKLRFKNKKSVTKPPHF